MKKNIKIAIAVLASLVLLVGLALLLYPFVSNLWNEARTQRLLTSYVDQTLPEEEGDGTDWIGMAHAYNETLLGTTVPDAFAFADEADEDYLAQLAYRGDGVMGYLSIPRISVNLPVYHTTSTDVLQHGVGHLPGSSLPVGGESTHCVLSAHRGLPSAALFTDLDLLDIGDHFYLYVLDEVLSYEVDQILTVDPYETQPLAITPGADYVTLVTCTPYSVNTSRLLVRGHRVAYEEDTHAAEERHPVKSPHTRYGLWTLGGLLGAAVILLLLFLLHNRCRKGT